MQNYRLFLVGIVLAASFSMSAVRAEIGAEPRQPQSAAPPSDPAATTPGAEKTTTGLPGAREKGRPGVGSRALTGTDPGPGPTKPLDPTPVK